MSIFLIFLRFLHCKVLPGKVRESFRSSSFSVCHDRQDTNIKVLCKRINALNERVTAGGGVKSDRLISCKSSPSGDSLSEQESELDSHCEHSPTRPKKNKLARREVHKLLLHSAPSRKCRCVSQSAVTAAMPSSLGSALCFKFNSLSLELVLVARQMQFNSINQIESQANPILQRACLVAAPLPPFPLICCPAFVVLSAVKLNSSTLCSMAQNRSLS